MVKAYQGIHGTCQTWGEQIVTNGFIPLPGKLGIGSYFWRYYEQDTYTKFLAFRWWQYKFKKEDYNRGDVKSKKCVILNCYFHIEDEVTEVLDLSDGALKEQLIDFIKSGIQQIQQDHTSLKIDNIAVFIWKKDKNPSLTLTIVILNKNETSVDAETLIP